MQHENRQERRIRRARITWQLLETILRDGRQAVQSDAPSDLRVVNIEVSRPERDTQTILVLCESEAFAPVMEGAVIPDFTITLANVPLPAEEQPDAA